MKVRRNLFMIGLSLTIAVAIVIFSILWLGKSNFFMRGLPLNLVVDNADGIAVGNEVFYRGLKVGSVTDASVTTEGVVLKLKIEDVDKIPIDSRFKIGDLSLMSGTAVQIIPGSSAVFFQPNDTVRGYAAYGMSDALSGLQNLESQFADVMRNVNALTGKGTRLKVDSVLDNLDKTVMQLNVQVNGNLKQTLTNVNQITADNKDNITFLIRSLSENSRQLSAFLNTSSESAKGLDSLLANLNAGKGSLGNIMKSDSLYRSLSRTIGSIDSLVTDIKANPKKYINVSVF